MTGLNEKKNATDLDFVIIYTILWRNVWAPQFFYNVIFHHKSADNGKQLDCSVPRLHVYLLWWIKKNGSFLVEFNFIHVFFVWTF